MGEIADAVARGLAMVDGRKNIGGLIDYDSDGKVHICWYGALWVGSRIATLDELEDFTENDGKINTEFNKAFPGFYRAMGDVSLSEMNDNEVEWGVITAKAEELYYGSN